MNNAKPTYNELEKMFELEKNLKNSMYYYLTFKDYLQNYYTWVNIEGMNNVIDATKRMKMILHIEKMCVIRDATKSRITGMEFNIHPN